GDSDARWFASLRICALAFPRTSGVAVNLRLTAPEPIASLPIDHFGGLDTWEDLPRDGRCGRDLRF
ncbi:MAG TPA: hypothetical protein VKT00_01700, partial [Casimicrobiaceae bacterium]|nr:hypothetical protein [Casimicrobiaceae bacterium]